MTNDQIPRIGAAHRQTSSAVQYGVRLRSGQVVACADRAAADEVLAALPFAGGVLVQRSEWTNVEDVAAQQREERAEAEARPHDDEPKGPRPPCAAEGCYEVAGPSGRCDNLAHAVPPSECGCGGPLAHDSEDPRCAYFAGRVADRG